MLNVNSKESPEYLRMSLAGTITLGFRRGRFYRNAALHCLNLLLTYTEGCSGNCAYCGLSVERQGSYEAKSFIRVDWPTYPLDEILCRLDREEHDLKRICISMITNPRAISDTKLVSQRILEAKLDFSLSHLSPPPLGQYRRIQLAQYLIEKDLTCVDDSSFSQEGDILNFGIDREVLDEVIQAGRPFKTSGCPGCNRPYANSRPGPEIRNYPFSPAREDVERVREQICLR